MCAFHTVYRRYSRSHPGYCGWHTRIHALYMIVKATFDSRSLSYTFIHLIFMSAVISCIFRGWNTRIYALYMIVKASSDSRSHTPSIPRHIHEHLNPMHLSREKYPNLPSQVLSFTYEWDGSINSHSFHVLFTSTSILMHLSRVKYANPPSQVRVRWIYLFTYVVYLRWHIHSFPYRFSKGRRFPDFLAFSQSTENRKWNNHENL